MAARTDLANLLGTSPQLFVPAQRAVAHFLPRSRGRRTNLRRGDFIEDSPTAKRRERGRQESTRDISVTQPRGRMDAGVPRCDTRLYRSAATPIPSQRPNSRFRQFGEAPPAFVRRWRSSNLEIKFRVLPAILPVVAWLKETL